MINFLTTARTGPTGIRISPVPVGLELPIIAFRLGSYTCRAARLHFCGSAGCNVHAYVRKNTELWRNGLGFSEKILSTVHPIWTYLAQKLGLVSEKPAIKRHNYRGADKSLARPGRKQATATEDFDFHISYL